MQLSNIRDISIEELAGEFTRHDFELIEKHQDGVDDPIAAIIEGDFYPSDPTDPNKQARLIGAISCNTAMFDDKTEDLIYEDPVVLEILDAKNEYPEQVDILTQALRARRSVVAFLMHETTGLADVFDITDAENHSSNGVA